MDIRLAKTATALTSVAVVMISGCGHSTVGQDLTTTGAQATSASSVQTPGPALSEGTITISGFGFSKLTVAPGAQITVQNNDAAEHTVTSNTPDVFNVEVGGRSKATFTAPSQPGSYPFHCAYHSSMHGTLTVQ
jgi:plastocyanin